MQSKIHCVIKLVNQERDHFSLRLELKELTF